jgi:AcrR family transcriptional regulator
VTDRRTVIADAAIATLAREGLRGFTHRAVDRTAGLAEGSTSYYFRTREALMSAALARLAELDTLDIDAFPNRPGATNSGTTDSAARAGATGPAERAGATGSTDVEGSADVEGPVGAADPASLETMVALLTTLVWQWLTDGRERTLARYELTLESTRRPAVRAKLRTHGAAFRVMAEQTITVMGASEPKRRAATLVAYLDGLLLHQLTRVAPSELDRDELNAACRDLLTMALA